MFGPRFLSLGHMARILIITSIFPPTIGGPAVFSDRLAHALSANGHQVTVLTPSEVGRKWADDATRPFKVLRVSMSNRYVYEVMVRLMLGWALLTHKTVLLAGLELYATPIARLLRRRFILRIPGDIAWEQGRNWGMVTERFDEFQATQQKIPAPVAAMVAKRKVALNLASAIVAPSEYLKRVIVGWGVPAERITYIRNGVPLHGFSDHQVALRTGDLDVLFAARLTNWKGGETLLLALQGLAGIRCEIVGEGPMAPTLHELARQLNLANVKFTAKMSQPELHARMKTAHVFALCSDYEGLSHALQEAGAAGLARIASRIPGNEEVVHDQVDGLLFPYGDVNALRAALIRLRDDDVMRVRLGQAAQAATSSGDDFAVTVAAYAKLLES